MSISITQGVDLAVRTLLYSKFSDLLGISFSTIYNQILQYPREVALRERSEKTGSDVLEFMNFWRMSTSPSWGRQRTPLARRGIMVGRNSSGPIIVKAQPVDLNYNFWVWSKSLETVYQCVERYILWQHNSPKVNLEYEFDDGHTYDYSPDLHFGEVVDESTFAEKYTKGVLVIYKFPIKLDGWVLDSSDSGGGIVTKIRVTIYDKDDLTEYSEIVAEEDSSYNEELADALRLSRRSMYGISSVDLVSNCVIIGGNRTSDFSVGGIIKIEGSTNNDNVYSVVSVSAIGSNTSIILGTNTLVDNTADGVVVKADVV